MSDRPEMVKLWRADIGNDGLVWYIVDRGQHAHDISYMWVPVEMPADEWDVIQVMCATDSWGSIYMLNLRHG